MKIYVPSSGADDWARLLAEPVKHWRTGYSARSLAHCWEAAQGFPPEVKKALATCPALSSLEMLIGLPEHQVHLPGGTRPSQTDLWVLARGRDGLCSIAVEGKVAEPFGPTIGEWLQEASLGKRERLSFLQAQLGVTSISHSVRYQLLHRTVSAVLEAKRFGARHALLLVHSFSKEQHWFSDFSAFAEALGAHVTLDAFQHAATLSGIQLWLGWVRGDETFLTA